MFHFIHQLGHHWAEVAVIYILIQKILTAIQDALDALPKGTPILRKIITVMQGAGQYLLSGNRIVPIQTTQQQVEDKK